MTFREFINAFNDGSVRKDATWRAYDIPGMVPGMQFNLAEKALKELHYRTRGQLILAIARISADYQISSPDRAAQLLAMWQLWKEIATGQRRRGLVQREVQNDG